MAGTPNPPTVEEQIQGLRSDIETLAALVEEQQGFDAEAFMKQVDEKIAAAVAKVPTTSINIDAKKKEGPKVPEKTFKHNGKTVKFNVAAIRLGGKKILMSEILEGPAAARSALVKKYPNIVTPAE